MAKNKTDVISLDTGMLAFARSIQISEGLFFGLAEEGDQLRRIPIPVLEKGVRGQSSEDNAKNPGLSNPQVVEAAVVPNGCDRVMLGFSLRILPFAMKPYACGAPDVDLAWRRLASGYAAAGGFRTLAELYVWNIANGRFAWRNRFQSDEMSVTVRFGADCLIFDPLRLSLDAPADRSALADALTGGDAEGLGRLIDGFAGGLADKAFSCAVDWTARMNPGQEIFPSQEYVREDRKVKDVSRVYAKLPVRGSEVQQASMHSQKIGAALRHIDIWHGDPDYDAIAVNPYGGVQQTGDVLRKPETKKSFYDLRKKAAALISVVEAAAEGNGALTPEVHFVMANLVRGGVFGSSSKKAEASG